MVCHCILARSKYTQDTKEKLTSKELCLQPKCCLQGNKRNISLRRGLDRNDPIFGFEKPHCGTHVYLKRGLHLRYPTVSPISRVTQVRSLLGTFARVQPSGVRGLLIRAQVPLLPTDQACMRKLSQRSAAKLSSKFHFL